MKTSDAGRSLIKGHEGIRLEAYPDPGTGGDPWTIGYGHTKGVRQGDTCDEAQADAWLIDDLADAEECVSTAVEVDLSQQQFDALVSFVFNVGCSAFRNSTLLRLLNQSNYDGAAQQFGRWNKAAGNVLAGLTRRRHDEANLFLS